MRRDPEKAGMVMREALARIAVLEAAIDDYSLWEPRRAGHAAAHKRLMEARNAT